MRGRKPKTSAQHAADGDLKKRGVKKLAAKIASEPQPQLGLPKCPAHLKGLARSAWGFWCEQLAVMAMDRRPDSMALEGACVAYETMIASYETVRKEGRVIVKKMFDEDTNEFVVLDMKPHPASSQGDRAAGLLKAFCSEFGFTPVSRTRLAVDSKKDDSMDLAALLSAPREPKAAVQ